METLNYPSRKTAFSLSRTHGGGSASVHGGGVSVAGARPRLQIECGACRHALGGFDSRPPPPKAVWSCLNAARVSRRGMDPTWRRSPSPIVVYSFLSDGSDWCQRTTDPGCSGQPPSWPTPPQRTAAVLLHPLSLLVSDARFSHSLFLRNFSYVVFAGWKLLRLLGRPLSGVSRLPGFSTAPKGKNGGTP